MVKSQIRQWLAAEDYGAIVDLAGRNRRTLSFLTALTYDPDRLLSWRAIKAIGLAAGRIAGEDPELVRNHILRLLWLLNDESGGIGWRAPEAIGEMIRARPDRLSQFLPIAASLLDMVEEEDIAKFQPGMLWATGRLAQVRPAALRPAIPYIIPCLADPDPQTRGLAAWCLGQLGHPAPLRDHPALLSDDSPVEFFTGDRLTQTSVAALAREALGETEGAGKVQ